MEDLIMRDLKAVLDDEILLPEFIKLDDVKEMYEFCKKVNKEQNYTEADFKTKVDKLIESLPEELGGTVKLEDFDKGFYVPD